MSNTINGVTGNAQAYSVLTQKNQADGNIARGSYNDPDRKLEGVFTEEQIRFLGGLKNDPVNKRLIDNKQMGKDQFMHILLRQLANQNPLNPMEDKDFIAQMAQFSSLEGMQNLNKSFEATAKDLAVIKAHMISLDGGVVSLLKIKNLLEQIAKKLGIEKPGEKTEKNESSDKADKERKKIEVNTEIAKKNAGKAYDI